MNPPPRFPWKLALAGWLCLPVIGIAYHAGPGQDRLVDDRAGLLLASAQEALGAGDTQRAQELLAEAATLVPPGDLAAQRRIELESAKAGMQCGGLPDSRERLGRLVDALTQDPDADPALTREARQALASSQFYMTWLMRLEGLERAEWEPEIEAARQNYRLLAEAEGDDRAAREKDLAAAIRLQRMDLDELMGLPLPNQ
ncbi:MAG: hypothetical protein R3F62_09930 [Planctomycetota bacterium]